MRRSILTEKIARRGRHIYQEHGVDPLERVFAGEVMSHQVQTVDAAATIGAVLASHFGASQAHRAYPVQQQGVLLGMLDRAMLQPHSHSQPNRPVADLFNALPPAQVALPTETCRQVASRMARYGLERLPVVANASSQHIVGIVSRSDLIKPTLAHFHEDEQREQMRGLPWKVARR
jgi:Mg/Co/Ni transporter MgtE